MSAGPWVLHEAFVSRLMNKELDLDTDDIKLALLLSTSNAATTSVNNYASLTNEVANGNGYTTGGIVCTGETITGGATVPFDVADVTVTASGGTIAGIRFGVLYDNTDTNKTVIAHSILDNTPADINITDGNTLTVAIANVLVASRA